MYTHVTKMMKGFIQCLDAKCVSKRMQINPRILTKQNSDDLDQLVNTIPSVLLKNVVLSRTGMPGMCVHLFRTPECNYDLRGGERRNGNRGQTKGTDLLLPSLKTAEMMKRLRLFSLRDLKDTEALSFSSTAPINKQAAYKEFALKAKTRTVEMLMGTA